jgi:2-oxoisovalerate dehydrogenase E2 component (dihydrolipoyl transacylase)
MSAFSLPDLGEGLKEAEIVAWHVAEGDHVVVDQPLVSVETEKAVVDIPSPRAGRIAQFLARPGDHIQVGAPLLTFEEGVHPDSGTVVGDLGAAASAQILPVPSRQGVADRACSVQAAPAVRARAKELGVDLSRIAPTGPDGRVTLADVERIAALSPREPLAEDEQLRGARRAMALSMAQAGREVVPATLYDDADIEFWSGGDFTVRLIRAMVAGCGAEPRVNASFDATRLSLRNNPQVDLGVAIDSPDGLFVPVLRDVGHASAAELRGRIDDLKRAVRDRSLAPAELRGPTITLSNFGTIAGQYAALVVVPPQVAILGAGRVVDRPVRSAKPHVMHRMLPLSLTFDHRAITGGETARFLRAVIADLEKPD